MKIAIVYDSRTGNTAAAAESMGTLLRARGHACTVQRLVDASPAEVGAADLVCVGSWTQGLFVFLQHPTAASLRFVESLPELRDKRAVVFCSYKIAAGGTLKKMARAIEAKGARVVGRFKLRGRAIGRDFEEFARELD